MGGWATDPERLKRLALQARNDRARGLMDWDAVNRRVALELEMEAYDRFHKIGRFAKGSAQDGH